MHRTTPTLGDGVTVDIQKLIDLRLLVQANSGGGKSYLIRKLCEIAYGHAQIIVIDVEGEFYTLREHFDFLLAGKDNADCPASVASASILARHLLELGTSAIIDIYELGAKRAQFISAFIGGIMEAPRSLWHDTIIVLDETNKFCPEDAAEQASTRSPRGVYPAWDSTAAIIDLMTRGRKRGFCGVLATQRLAAVNKNAAAECNNFLIGRCNLDVDIDRAAKKLGIRKVDAQRKLPQLRAGQFFAGGDAFRVEWSPGSQVAQIQVGSVITTHPKRGQKVPIPPTPATVKKVLAQLANITEEAETEIKTKDDLLRVNADLIKQITELKQNSTIKTSEANAHFAAEWKQGWEAEKKANRYLAEENRALVALIRSLKVLPPKLIDVAARMKDVPNTLVSIAAELAVALDHPTGTGLAPVTKPTQTKIVTHEPTPGTLKVRDMPVTNGMQPAEQRMLDTIALLERLNLYIDKSRIAAWYGAHPNSRGFMNILSRLRTRGYLMGWNTSQLGKNHANAIDIPDRAALRARLLDPLKPDQRRMMEIILEYGRLTKPELAQRYGAHPNTRGFLNVLSKLRSRGLATDGWPVQPSDVFTLEVR